ncbi:MAG: peptidoglycan DD-metalloendopeptidase family protein, partial [Pseudohongiella sp.]|nr:peptidoglycan DD-metalloendopeptidase family protein [Pseudohongiella sp.]
QVEGVSWQWPADGRLLSTFSETSAARGIDIAGISGQAVYAAADGDVVYAGSGIQGAGNLVIVRHNDRYLSAYMHNSTMLVREGDQVRAGDKIAEMGAGPNGRDMLHFEVRVDGKPVDPVRYLPNR